MLAISSSNNDSLLNPYFSPNDLFYCLTENPENIIYSVSSVINVILLLPFYLFILYMGFQQLQQKSSITHCDIFTYHLVVMELIGVLGLIVSFSGSCVENAKLFSIGILICSFTWYGQIFFHTMTCVERYLAVVHPITYLSLKNEKGIRIRNICIGSMWLVSLGGSYAVATGNNIYLESCVMASAIIIIFFCSVSVLCVLIRPGPSRQGRERADKSKQKVFYIILFILGILMFRLCCDLLWAGLDLSGNNAQCMMLSLAFYINLPSSLVLPLLFLKRRGHLLCVKSV